MNLALMIETTIKGAAIGVCDLSDNPPKLIWHGLHATNHGSSAALVEQVKAASLELSLPKCFQWRGLVVSVGPGSFTGIKVGIAFAQGFGFGLKSDVAIVPVNGLALVARRLAQMQQTPEPIIVCLPATASFGYTAYYDAQSGEGDLGVLDLSATQMHSAIGWQSGGRFDFKHSKAYVIGKWPALLQRLTEAKSCLSEIAVEASLLSALYAMADEAARLLENPLGLNALEPLYLRLSTPEERLR